MFNTKALFDKTAFATLMYDTSLNRSVFYGYSDITQCQPHFSLLCKVDHNEERSETLAIFAAEINHIYL